MFTTIGKNQVRNWLAGTTSTAPLAIAVGTTSTSATINDTALGGEVFRSAFDSTTISPQNVDYEVVMATTDATTSTVTEMGLFNNTDSTSGDCFTRNTFAAITKTSSIEIQFDQRVEIN